MAEEKEREKPIEKMTVKELRVLAKELGAEAVSAMGAPASRVNTGTTKRAGPNPLIPFTK